MQLILFLVTKAIVCLSKDEKVAVNIAQMRVKLEGTCMLMSIPVLYSVQKRAGKKKKERDFPDIVEKIMII